MGRQARRLERRSSQVLGSRARVSTPIVTRVFDNFSAASAPGGLRRLHLEPRAYFLDGAGHVRELSWWGGGWHDRDVTSDAGSQPAVAGSAVAAMGIVGEDVEGVRSST